MSETNKKIKYLVADTTAFINAVQLNEYAVNILTVPDVVKEVKNKRQIRRLCVLPFDLQVREPRIENIKHCVEFAKKTGDYASLSGIDVKIISLTYELEADNVGTDHIREHPVIPQIVASKEKPSEFQETTKPVGWYNPGNKGESDNESEVEEEEDDEEDESEDELQGGNIDLIKKSIEDQIANSNCSDEDEVLQEELNKCFEKLACNSEVNDILVPTRNSKSESDGGNNDLEGGVYDHGVPNDEITDDGWITPSNLKKAQKSLQAEVDNDIRPLVACMSTDFAIQNVLKQMNLNVAALDGRVIKHLRTYTLRCYACFKTTSIMTKVFCPNCGNKTLKRVAVSLDENGKQVIHINTRRPLTAKYKNQPLPRFRGGKHSRNPILFEDQPIPRQMPTRVAKTKTNALEEDYITGYSPFVMRDVDSKSAVLRSKGRIKEWARNNTFEEDRRRKQYNRLYK